MKLFIRSAVAAVALIGGVLVGLACTDDEGNELTLEEYFAALEELDQEANAQTDALFEGIDDDSDVEAIKEAVNGIPDIIAEFNAGLEDLDPPEAAQDAHDEAVSAAQAFEAIQETTLASAQDAETFEEFQATFDDPAFVEADERFQSACTDLAQIATDNDIEVNLGCVQ